MANKRRFLLPGLSFSEDDIVNAIDADYISLFPFD